MVEYHKEMISVEVENILKLIKGLDFAKVQQKHIWFSNEELNIAKKKVV